MRGEDEVPPCAEVRPQFATTVVVLEKKKR